MSTSYRDWELIDACERGDVEYLRRAAASGVVLKTVVNTNLWNGTLLHTASRYDVTLFTLWFEQPPARLPQLTTETAPILCSILVMIDSVLTGRYWDISVGHAQFFLQCGLGMRLGIL